MGAAHFGRPPPGPRTCMAIYGQPNSWTCGPFALKHALLALGLFVSEDELASVAGSTEEKGTDEPGLRRAGRAYGVQLRLERGTHADKSRRELARWLGLRLPVLLCLDQWDHWVTAVAANAEHVVLFDSKYDAPLRAEPWGPLLERLACRRRHLGGLWTRCLYDLHPVVPRRAPRQRLALTPDRAHHLLRAENAPLAQRWDEYARALLPYSAPPAAQLEFGFTLESFIHARRGAILDVVTAFAGDAHRAQAARVVDGLAFVAGMYQLALRPDLEAEAVRQLAAIAAGLFALEAAPLGTARAAPAAA